MICMSLTACLTKSNINKSYSSLQRTLLVYCTAGLRSGHAAVELGKQIYMCYFISIKLKLHHIEKQLKRPVFNLHGGVIAWANAGTYIVYVHMYMWCMCMRLRMCMCM